MFIRELEKFSPGDYFFDVRDQLKRYVYDRTERALAAGDAARDAIRSPQALATYCRAMRRKFIEGLGGLPSSEVPLDARVVGTVPDKGFRIEKVIFESRPKVFVTANLYIPDGITSPRGAVLFVCGHAEEAKGYPEYQTVCRYLVKAGLIVLAQDPVGQGERVSYYERSLNGTTIRWGTQEHDYVGGQVLALGDSLARYFVHDAMRGIDYLRSRPEVDPKKIGVTGNSGGGTQTSLMMMCDPRIAAAAPGTFLMDRKTYMYAGGAQDAEQIWPGATANGFDHEDILLMMAPKPVRVLAVTSDFFPIEGTRRTVQRAKRIWAMLGRKDNLDLVEDFSTHEYTRVLARAAVEFFSKHLLGRKVTPADGPDIEPIDPRRLWCTKSGQVRGEIKDARFVFEENLDRLTQIRKTRRTTAAAARRARAIRWLRDRVFDGRKPGALNPRFYWKAQAEDLAVEAAFWWSQEDLVNSGLVFRDYRLIGKDLPVTIAVWDQGSNDLRGHEDWIRRTCRAGRAVMVLNVSGAGAIAVNPQNAVPVDEFYGAIHKFNDDLVWLNDSIAALRIYDVLRALDMVKAWPGLKAGDIRLYGHGRHGLYARVAGVLDDRVRKTEIVGGMGSYAEWVTSRHYNCHDIRSVIIPGILKYADLPEFK